MYMSHTYNLARTVREKFQDQAAVKDHNLRILVAHANLYDNLLQVLGQEAQVVEAKPEQVDPRVVHIENSARERRKRSIKFAATSHPRHEAASPTENATKPSPIAIPAGGRDHLREAYSVVSVDELEVSDEEEEESEDDDDASLESGSSLPEIYYESDSEEESEWDEDQEYYDDFDDLDDCNVEHCSYTPETILRIARDLEVLKLDHH